MSFIIALLPCLVESVEGIVFVHSLPPTDRKSLYPSMRTLPSCRLHMLKKVFPIDKG